MKRAKRFLALLMCFVLCFSMISTSAFADETEAAMQDEVSISSDASEDDSAVSEQVGSSEELTDEDSETEDIVSEDPDTVSDEDEITVTEIEETEEVTIEEKTTSDGKVRVTFVPDAEGTAIAVYQNDQLVEPVEDETYVYELLPGSYKYNTACTGYITVYDTELIVEAAEEQTVEITSVELPSAGIYAQDLNGDRYFTDAEETALDEDASAEEKVNMITRDLYDATYYTSASAFASATKSKITSMRYGYYCSSTKSSSYDYDNATYMSSSSNESFSAGYKIYGQLTSSGLQSIVGNIEDAYVTHTGKPYEGDYIREALFSGMGYGASNISYSASTGYTTFDLSLSPYYHTSASQQSAVESAADSLVSSLNLTSSSLSDYDKLKAINTWLMKNVRYGYSDYQSYRHTVNYYNAYGPLVNKKAVCQGFSCAYYLLALKAGVDARIITSSSMCHAWNIVKVAGSYYYCDATWDSNSYDKGTETTSDDGGSLKYFLQGTNHWADSHTRGDQYLSSYSYFTQSKYPVPSSDYSGYTISYNLNGGSGSISSTSSDGSASRITSTVPSRSGYQFKGWATSSSGSVAYASGALYTKCTSITLYAVWDIPKYTVTFNANGGSVSTSSKTVALGSTYGTLPTPTRSGYTFLGWYTATSGGSKVTSSTTVTNAANHTLYARWSQNITISTQPANVIKVVGNTATFTVTATGVKSYQWQVSTDGGSSWTSISSDAAKTKSYSLTVASTTFGKLYRCKLIGDISSNVKYTNSVKVIEGIKITSQPKDATVVMGGTAKFTVTATGVKSYQWKKSTDGGTTWTYCTETGNTTKTLTVTLTSSNKDTLYICKLTGTSGQEKYTNSAKLKEGVKITTQPVSVTKVVGNTAKFTVTASNVKTYQWQLSTDGGSTWSSMSSDAAKTSSYSLTVASTTFKKYYRCKLTGYGGEVVYTDKVRVIEGLKITTQPKNVRVVMGGTAKFTVEATGAKSYQWKESTDGGTTWTYSTATGNATKTLSVTLTSANKDKLYICKVTGTAGETKYTNSVKILEGIKITTQPVSVTKVVGNTAKFSVSATGVKTYQWQVSTDGGETWSSISSDAAKASSYSITVASTTFKKYYRCKLTSDSSQVVYTNKVRVIEGIKITTQPASVTKVAGNTAKFSVTATGVASYQWQLSTDGGETWTSISNDAAKTSSYSLTVASTTFKKYYRCKLTSANKEIVYTNKVRVIEGIKITTQPVSLTRAVGSTAKFSVTASGVASYQWQVSTDGGSTWTSISSDAAKVSSYSVTVASSTYNKYYRCKLTSANKQVVYTNKVHVIKG